LSQQKLLFYAVLLFHPKMKSRKKNKKKKTTKVSVRMKNKTVTIIVLKSQWRDFNWNIIRRVVTLFSQGISFFTQVCRDFA
jgi:hypothetical protein